jgi:hypothetical protein
MFLLLPESKIYILIHSESPTARILAFHECVPPSAYVSLTRLLLCLLLTSYEPFYDLTFSEGRRDMGASAHALVYRNHLRYPSHFLLFKKASSP